MANQYFNHDNNRVPGGSLARADQVNNIGDEIAAAFDSVAQQDSQVPYIVAAGTGNVVILSVSGVTEHTDGDQYWFRAPGPNTGAATLNVSGIGAIEIVNAEGGSLPAGVLMSNGIYNVRYSEPLNKFILVSASGNSLQQALAAAASASSAAVSAQEAEGYATEVQGSLATKADTTYVDAELALKEDTLESGVVGDVTGDNTAAKKWPGDQLKSAISVIQTVKQIAFASSGTPVSLTGSYADVGTITVPNVQAGSRIILLATTNAYRHTNQSAYVMLTKADNTDLLPAAVRGGHTASYADRFSLVAFAEDTPGVTGDVTYKIRAYGGTSSDILSWQFIAIEL